MRRPTDQPPVPDGMAPNAQIQETKYEHKRNYQKKEEGKIKNKSTDNEEETIEEKGKRRFRHTP
jgi:hypothetical protein